MLICLHDEVQRHDIVSNHIIAIDATNPIDHAVTLREYCNATSVEDTRKYLADLNVNCAEAGKSNFSAFITQVEALKNDKNPDKEIWRRKISDQAWETKKRNEAAIDGSKDKAIEAINKLPDRARDAAADLYARGMTGVGAFFRTIGLELTRIYEAIPEFLKGIWEKIAVAKGAVNSSFKAAINWIKGIFKISLESSQYSTFTKINSELGFVLDELSRAELDVNHLSIQRTADGWKLCP